VALGCGGDAIPAPAAEDLVSSSDEPTLPSPRWVMTPALGSHPLYTKPRERSRRWW